jgi:iron complex transport system permease protein
MSTVASPEYRALAARLSAVAPEPGDVLRAQGRRAARQRMWLIFFLGLAMGGVALSLFWGPDGFDGPRVLASFHGDNAVASAMIWSMRLPRLAIGALAGMGLALSGCVAQAVLRNPLASPFTLGISSGGAFGAALAMILWPWSAPAIPAMAIIFSLLTSLTALGVTRLRNATTETLVLAGVAVMFLFSALTSYIQYTAPQMELQRIVFWTFGSLAKAGWGDIAVAAAMILIPAPWVVLRSWDLNLILCGDETAQSLGVSVSRLKVLGIVAMSVMSAGAICFCGVIGFIGLVAPHMARLAVGNDHRILLPASAALGVALVILADLAGRILYAPLVIPVGIMTSFVGVPFFFWLIIRDSRRRW